MTENSSTHAPTTAVQLAGWYQVGTTDVDRWWDGTEWGGDTRPHTPSR